jgi:hypothetical protein
MRTRCCGGRPHTWLSVMLASANGDKGALSHLSSFNERTRAAQQLTLAPAHGARNRAPSRRALSLTARQAWDRIGGLTPLWSPSTSRIQWDWLTMANRRGITESTGRYLSSAAQSSFGRARTVFAMHRKSDRRRKPLRCVRCNSVLQARTMYFGSNPRGFHGEKGAVHVSASNRSYRCLRWSNHVLICGLSRTVDHRLHRREWLQPG